MRWDDVWLAVSAAIEEHADIAPIMGQAIYLDGERDFEVPSLTGLFVGDFEDERFAPVDIQLNVYTRTLEDLVTVESAVRRLLNRDVRVEIGGVRMWAQFQAGRTLFGPATDRWFGRQLEFRFTPIRSRYARPVG